MDPLECAIALKIKDETFLFECYIFQDELMNENAGRTWSALDLHILPADPYMPLLDTNGKDVSIFFQTTDGTHTQELTAEVLGSQAAYDFFLRCLIYANSKRPGLSFRKCIARIVTPRKSGYLIRGDIFQLRMADCSYHVQDVTPFATSHQKLAILSPSRDIIHIIRTLPGIIECSLGGFLIKETRAESTSYANFLLERELDNRLSFSWLTPKPRARKTLALVEGGRSLPERPGVSSRIYLAAQALSIDLVVLDVPGHWIEGPKYEHWRKAFIPINLVATPDFPSRITRALSQYDGLIDGIITFCDMFSAAVAESAMELSLPTEPPSALKIATDKYQTSIFDAHRAFKATSIEEAKLINEEESLDYPLIVKPCNGWGSEGVRKVQTSAELLDAVAAIDTDRHGKEFVIEKYCDGPEVDANFVLWRGEIVYFELSDDVPKGAELSNADEIAAPSNFHELANVLPSALPEAERDMLKTSLHEKLLRLGFMNGFFHVEARVQDSTMEYRVINDQNNILDLVERSAPLNPNPSAWLIEINPRPPGIVTSSATKTTYGVDYWGIAMLCALGDEASVRSLAIPFMGERASRYWCAALHIPAGKGGVFDSDNVCVELVQRHPDLAHWISDAGCFFRRGDIVPSPESGLNPMVAYLTVYSLSSRKHLLEVARRIRESIRFTIR